MATKGRIQVISCGGDRGEFIVQGVDTATIQLLMQAIGDKDGLKVEAAWVRRRGGTKMPGIRISDSVPKNTIVVEQKGKPVTTLRLTGKDDE